jgi:hypothetical protein
MKLNHPLVLLFGAGATRGALRTRSVPPPVDADFFEIAAQIKGHGTPALVRKVLGDVWTLYGRISGIGLENYYRDIETRAKISSFAKSANKPKDWKQRQENLEELIRRVVVHTTCKSVEKHLTPVSSRSHTAILRKLKAGDCILTFNYDLLIEESFKETQLWTPKTGYGVPVHGVTNEWCKNWLKHYFHGTGKHSKISLLKLHGSVHWALYKSGEIKLKDRPFVVRTRNKSTVFETVSILPPGLNKRIDKNPYKRLWKKARLKLEKCKTIIIIGYSLPEADLLARALFAEVVRLRGARRHYLKELHLADPIDSVKQRFIELFVPALNAQSKVFRYSGIEEFRSRVTEKAKSS